MGSPAFNPNAAFSVPAFDPKGSYQAQQAPTAAPADTRNFIQKGVDALTTVTPEQEAGHSWLTNKAQEYGAAAIQGLTAPFVHPIETAKGLARYAANPAYEGGGIIANAVEHPVQAAGNLTGGAILGEVAPAVIAPVADAMKKGAGRMLLLGKTPEGAYESALKPSTTLPQAQRTAIVQTGLQNEIPVSKGGLEKIGDLIDDYNQKIKAQIDSDPTRPIDPNSVATRADAAKARFAKQVNAGGDLQAIEDSKQQFLKENPTLNAADAQEMKQGTYRVLSGKFGEQGSASVEAQKALARGLKEEIADQFPEINALNAGESKLLDLQPILERAVNRISNHQLIGIGTPVAGAAAKAVTGSGSVGAVASVLKAVLDNPAMKSRLAIAVSKGANISFSQAAARVQAYSSALGSAVAGSQAYSSADNPSQPTTPQP